MTRRIKRSPDFEIVLQIKDEGFINPPRPAQRNWLLNRAMAEFADDLKQLDRLSAHFVPGVEATPVPDRAQALLRDEQIMEDWQLPLMQAMAEIVTETQGDVLEIGFGRGVSATYIQNGDVRSHTVVECNDTIVERFHTWRKDYPGRDIRLIHGMWQDTLDQLDQYDGIFFHTYPLNQAEYLEQALQSTLFAEHFFPTAATHLREGGVFTYLSHEIDSLSREHQRLLFRYFSRFTLSVVELSLPADIKDDWWAGSMVVVKAVK